MWYRSVTQCQRLTLYCQHELQSYFNIVLASDALRVAYGVAVVQSIALFSLVVHHPIPCHNIIILRLHACPVPLF
jgi:hypothetical protein